MTRDRLFNARRSGYDAGMQGITSNPHRRGTAAYAAWSKANRAARKRHKIEKGRRR